MYETLLNLYIQGKINDEKLEIAVIRGWISRMQKIQILSKEKR